MSKNNNSWVTRVYEAVTGSMFDAAERFAKSNGSPITGVSKGVFKSVAAPVANAFSGVSMIRDVYNGNLNGAVVTGCGIGG